MEATERLVRTWVASGRDQEIQETATAFSNGQITLLEVVKALGEYLTSEEDELRTKGVEFLSAVLGHCPHEKLNRQAARVLMTFFCSKLDDTETVIPALKGLKVLVVFPTSTSTDAIEIIRAIFSHVKMKSLVQSVRFLVFSIIDTFMARHRDSLKSLGPLFLSGYASLAEGEKDPRNLLVAFAIARVILIEFDIKDHVETLFNITFCYFPITFRPPPDDPYGISTDDLRVALRMCLNATPSFGPLAIPVFLEKLTAGSPATKRDTLQTLSSCLPVYGSVLARSSARKLWSSLKLEVFHPIDLITEGEALNTIQVLVKTIYIDGDSHTEDIRGFAREVCEECIDILREPEKSLAKPAIKILCAFMSTMPSVSRYTISQTVPHLLKLYLSPDEAPNRPSVLMLLSDVIAAARDSTSRISSMSADEADTPLAPFKDEVVGVVTSGLKSPTTIRPALDSIRGLVTTNGLLTDEELGFVVHSVNEILKGDPEESEDASDVALDILSTISITTPRHVEEQTLPLLLSSLPDQAPSRDAILDRAKYQRALSALTKLCLQPDLFETLVIRLTTKLDFICVPATSPSSETDTEPSIAYAHSIITALSNTLASKVDMGHVDIPKYIDRLVPRLYNLFIYSAVVPGGEHMVASDPRLVVVAAKIITFTVQSLPLQRQEIFAGALLSAYLKGDVKQLAQGHQKIPEDVSFLPFESGAPSLQKNLVALFAASVVALRKDVRVPVPNGKQFLDMLISWSLDMASNILQREAAWHAIASVVNKWSEGTASFLSESLEPFWDREVVSTRVSTERRKNAVQAWFWVSKAVLVRDHSEFNKLSDRLFEVFDIEDISWHAARAVGDLGGSDIILTKRHHAVIKFLHAQKYFHRVLPRIIEGAKSLAYPQRQTAYLVALTTLIKSVPKTMYMHELPSLVPLLLRGLDLEDTTIRANVIDTFLTVSEGGLPEDSILSEHASSLIATMVNNSMAQEKTSTRVRIAALRYLGVLPTLMRYDILHPHKPMVIRELGRVLDDPKRSVRKEAVDARTNWFECHG